MYLAKYVPGSGFRLAYPRRRRFNPGREDGMKAAESIYTRDFCLALISVLRVFAWAALHGWRTGRTVRRDSDVAPS